METTKITALEQVQTNSQELSLQDINEKQQAVSLYGVGSITSKVFADCVVRLKQAFPDLHKGFYDLLDTMLDEEKFTDQRLKDSVNNLIRTCVYPKPTIAQIIGFDKKIKVYTYYQLLEICNDYSNEMRANFLRDHPNVDIDGESRYVQKEFAKYFPERKPPVNIVKEEIKTEKKTWEGSLLELLKTCETESKLE